MPIFSYKCNKCGHSFDLLTGEELSCIECGSQDIQKSFASFGFKANVDHGDRCSSGGCGSCGL